jgi:Tol biopolymer transport system component
MTTGSRAVFLSYASEDADAAQRICEALRAAGIEVWFDKSELRGGDVWDRRIRQQIRDCALLLPIISRNTEARAEGYFRFEWHLADQRTYMMGHHRAFLVPICLDGTSEREADVPDSFTAVQWTRLSEVAPVEPLVARVQRLLAPGSPAPVSAQAPPAPVAMRRSRSRGPVIAIAVGALLTVSVAGIALLRRSATVPGAATLASLPVVAARTGREEWLDPLAQAKVLRLTDFAGTEQAAAISRDGKSAAFIAARDGHQDLWLTEIGSNRYRNLTAGRYQQLQNPEIRSVGFSPDGTLVTFWTRAGDGSRAQDINIMAAPGSGGPPQPYLAEAAEFDWSPDATQLVYHTTGPGDPIFLRGPTDARPRQIYVAAPGTHCHFPIWSPDGDYVYFVRGDPPSADWDVWRLHPSGAGLERLTFHDSQVTYPVLLDARTLLYLATDVDGSGPWLYVMDVPQKRARRVNVGLERYTSLAVDADGLRLVATVADVHSELWRVKVGNGPPAATAEHLAPVTQNASAPRYGPGYIAYLSNGGTRSGIWKYANGIASELWGDSAIDRVGAPAISPDGHRIAFTVERRGATQLYVVDDDGRNPRAVGGALALRGTLAWTPDSQAIVGAIVSGGQPRLARIFLDGTPPQSIVPDYSVDPVWSPDRKYFVYSGAQVATIFPLRASAPDGRPYNIPGLILTTGARRVAFAHESGSLVFLRGGIGRKDLWQLNLQAGAQHQLTALPSGFVITDFDVSPDGTEIVFERIEESSRVVLIERPEHRLGH